MATETLPPSVELGDPDAVPIVYFDHVPCYGVTNGSIQLELAASVLKPNADGKTKSVLIGTAHLRCSPLAARHLRDAIDRLLATMTRSVQQPPGSAAPVSPKRRKDQRDN